MAVNYGTVLNFFENIQFQLDGVPEAALIQAFISAEMIANPAWAVSPLNDGDRLDILKRLTGCTVGVGANFNCYPRGEAEVLCYDLTGDPLY